VDRLAERLADAARAVATLNDILREPPTVIVRDAAVLSDWLAAIQHRRNESLF